MRSSERRYDSLNSMSENGMKPFISSRQNWNEALVQAERGELIDGDEVFDELREMIEEHRPSQVSPR